MLKAFLLSEILWLGVNNYRSRYTFVRKQSIQSMTCQPVQLDLSSVWVTVFQDPTTLKEAMYHEIDRILLVAL